ncbi:MAG: hypothetical protein FWH07_07180 [Oscillospiraceae bacterium]|nr:hypothetical protein [Oscillospiraceae bacterium]
MFILAICGFIMNYDKPLAQLAVVGIAVSIVFCLIIGVNIPENAIVLNTLFYAWAFVTLIILLINKLIHNDKIKFGMLATIASLCLVFNAEALYRMYRFGIE